MMMPRKKRRMMIVSIILAILIIIGIIFLILYNTTDMFKSNDVLFQKYAIQMLNNVDSIFSEEYMNEVEELTNNNKLTTDINATVKYTENGDSSNPINNLQLKISGEDEKTASYSYKDITLMQDEEKLFRTEYIEDNGSIGIRLDGIKQYLSTNMDEENELTQIYNLVNTDIKEILELNSEEWNSLREKYIGIIWNNIANANFSKQTGVTIEINEAQYVTNVYSVTITKEQFNNMYINILQELEKEEVILSKLENIDNKINEYYNITEKEENSNIKQNFINKIENKIQEIENSNIGNDERTVSVFETNGVAISLSIDTEENFIGLDIINNEGNNFVNLLGNEKIKDNEKENSFDIKVDKKYSTNDETINITYNYVEEGNETKNECNINRKMEDSSISTNIVYYRNVNKNSLEFNIQKNDTIVNNFDEKEELTENDNNIVIENLSDEQKETVKNNIYENITNQINKVLEKVSMDNINKMLINIKLKDEELDDLTSEDNISDLEKNRFNSTFEFYEGENIEKERIKELIDLCKNDLGDIRITKYEERREEKFPIGYKLVIEKGKENTQLAEELISYIEENYNQEFSVKLEYDETTGLINNIYIEIMQNQ